MIYSEGCWIGPHLDRPDKRLTQIVYLQHPQDRLVGGDLLILGSDKMDDVVRSVPPRPNMSVVLLPSSQSWHAVSMLESASNAPRRCVLVHFSEVNDER
ncbi:2OG-Fe(II) oxygenase [Mesorhizobium huakuii]|uniref:2OG-Fe(II) oxygenase n=1 Tax=Mesorhizobium huakuii TaxID=28104 RepID=UPI003D7AF694